ncbi:hypothetical protein [Bacillus cereus]|uniref:hypothetical protein n=1 Tax=Bacillus cereus TaxID=1396 RepID=UPI002404D6CF|nr:hypothetical protein [Bacillus cereus]MDF9638810.1 hypothetical protein [Bacillus cereus]
MKKFYGTPVKNLQGTWSVSVTREDGFMLDVTYHRTEEKANEWIVEQQEQPVIKTSDKLTKKEVLAMDNEELMSALVWNVINSTKEVNARGGMTQRTRKEEKWIMSEVAERFGLDLAKWEDKVNN